MDVNNPVPQYTAEYLSTKSVAQLREICAQHNIRPGSGKRKAELISTMEYILNPSETEDTQLRQLLHNISNTKFDTEAKQHQLYREKFNAVDLHDRYWYKLPYNYQVKSSWKAAYLFAVMKIALINSWVLHNELSRMELKEYLLKIVAFLLETAK